MWKRLIGAGKHERNLDCAIWRTRNRESELNTRLGTLNLNKPPPFRLTLLHASQTPPRVLHTPLANCNGLRLSGLGLSL